MNGLFVTGTDTGVGKTAVSQALLRLAGRRGLRWIPFKPAESGFAPPRPGDADLLSRASPVPLAPDEVALYRFPLPVAPSIAAAAARTIIELPRLVERAHQLAARASALLVEGAGGLLTPYAPGVTAADIADALKLPVLVVARCSLGTINHTALSIAELRRRARPIVGVILVRVTPDTTPDQRTNAAAIATLTGIEPLGTLPWLRPETVASADSLADYLETAIGSRAVDTLLAGPSEH